MKIEQVTPAIGAELSDICLNNLTAKDYDDIYEALIEHKVIFFRDQDITPAAHLAFAKSFGEPEPPHPIYPSIEGYEQIVLLKSGAGSKPDTNDWHKDLTFKASPPFTSILHAIEVPDVGGDTLWSNTNAAYAALPKVWQDHLEGMEAMHDIGTFRNDLYRKGGIEAVNEGLKSTGSAVHKIIDTHPVSGLKYRILTSRLRAILWVRSRARATAFCSTSTSTWLNPSFRCACAGAKTPLPCGTTASLTTMLCVTICPK